MTAATMTFPFLPFSRNLSTNCLIDEEIRITAIVGEKRIFRNTPLSVLEIFSFPLTNAPEVLMLGFNPA